MRGAEAAAAEAAGTALPLAGGPVRFSACIAISRDAERPGREERWLSVPQLRERAAADPQLRARLEHLSAPRPAFAGLEGDASPRLMGVINVTPDSFSDGGLWADPERAVAHGRALAEAGAALIDVGGESTRPGAEPVSPRREAERVLPVVAALAEAGLAVSIDTRNASVMRAALNAGAIVVNDVSALAHDPDSLAVVAETGCSAVLMHSAGDPRTMQDHPRYDDVALDVYDFLEARVAACEAAGVPRSRLAVDPGFGFGKTPAHNLALVAAAALFHGLGCAVLLGVSRKSTIARVVGAAAREPGDRLPGSLALAQAAWDRGVQIARVHDAAETAQARSLWRALAGGADGR